MRSYNSGNKLQQSDKFNIKIKLRLNDSDNRVLCQLGKLFWAVKISLSFFRQHVRNLNFFHNQNTVLGIRANYGSRIYSKIYSVEEAWPIFGTLCSEN
jgi:hypothetical protein